MNCNNHNATKMNANTDPYTFLKMSMALDPFDEKIVADDATASTYSSRYSSSMSSSSQLSGWGSAISRKSYACLRTLEAECLEHGAPKAPPAYPRPNEMPRQQSHRAPLGDSWGYFVDTKDS